MMYKTSDGVSLIQFMANSDKEAKAKVKEFGSDFKLLKTDIDIFDIDSALRNFQKTILTSFNEKVEQSIPTLVEQEAKDFILSKNSLLAPYLVSMYGEDKLEEVSNSILTEFASKRSSLAKERKDLDVQLETIKKCRELLLSDPASALELTNKLLEV